MNEVTKSATLIAQRPTLHELLVKSDKFELPDYLNTLRITEGLDFLVVCDNKQEMVELSAMHLPPDTCATQTVASNYWITGDTSPEAWLSATQPIIGSQGGLGVVVVGVKLDDDFATKIGSLTGLEHAIFVNDQMIASSYPSSQVNRTVLLPRSSVFLTASILMRSKFELSGQPYYAARLPLEGSPLEIEIALRVADIEAAQKRLVTLLAGSMIVVAAMVSFLGVILARHISQPLVSLANTAARFSQGDLSSPVVVESRVREVVQVSQAIEGARKDLLEVLTHLRQEKAWINHLLESIVEGVMTLDEECRITFFSHGAERITGWKRTEVLNHNCDDVFYLADNDIKFSDTIPIPDQKKRIVVTLADGKQASLSITRAQLMPTESGEAQVALVFRDVSQEEVAHRLLSYFLANITHEFRTPLSALAASIELLIDQASHSGSTESDELLTSLHLGVLSLQNLVDNLLESASIEAGHFRVSPRPYDLSTIISNAVQTMHPLLDKYLQRIVLELPQPLPFVQADPRRVEQVLINLLANASKYGPPDAEITLSVAVQDGWVRVSVSDRGPGIPPERRGDLFRRFEHFNPDSDHAKAGIGLGLSVVKAVVEAHAGQAVVEDRPDGGSTFWFTLPVAKVL
jgi:PAS domain S-box-containing protein